MADTKADVDAAQNAVDTAQKIVDGEQSDADAQKALDDAKANEQAASDAVNNATADKAAAEKADSDRQAAIDDAKADVEKATQTDTGAISQEIADANKTIADSDATIADADKTIAEADKTISENTDKIKEIEKNTATTPTAPKPTLPEGYDLDGTGGYTAMEEAQKATMELNKSYQIPAFNVQTNTTEADRNTTVDISNPISEQLKGDDTPTTPIVDEKSELEKAKEAKEQELADAKAAVAQQEENIKSLQEWFDDQMNCFKSY
ncbi:hypothetical protein ACTQ4F_05610 [Streptococcus alactolyticus]|uniref:hypothetical protein n=1 Tax=Streptococcus alactolyticus TaxID=29389 RepID=UPI003F968ADF